MLSLHNQHYLYALVQKGEAFFGPQCTISTHSPLSSISCYYIIVTLYVIITTRGRDGSIVFSVVAAKFFSLLL